MIAHFHLNPDGSNDLFIGELSRDNQAALYLNSGTQFRC